jgi:hypothetical protein
MRLSKAIPYIKSYQPLPELLEALIHPAPVASRAATRLPPLPAILPGISSEHDQGSSWLADSFRGPPHMLAAALRGSHPFLRSFGDQGGSLDQTESIPLTEYCPRGLVV